jgi:hypothetical protein
VWYVYLAFYVTGAVLSLYGPLIMPVVVAIPLLLASTVFAVLTWPVSGRAALWIIAGSILQLGLGMLLLGGPGTTVTFSSGATYGSLPGFPRPIVPVAWFAGLILPLLLMGFSLWLVRDRQWAPWMPLQLNSRR